ncbi:tex261 protein [Anaeramoeba flamelloides]|uniref:Tex261 protein n=1 Tax=Anaeramoeba flamelloides TaxID=1746091 RepID=A0ABQ8XWC2_9EUKA|nr:tex261 protein [Anaeramoeba flamelloides]
MGAFFLIVKIIAIFFLILLFILSALCAITYLTEIIVDYKPFMNSFVKISIVIVLLHCLVLTILDELPVYVAVPCVFAEISYFLVVQNEIMIQFESLVILLSMFLTLFNWIIWLIYLLTDDYHHFANLLAHGFTHALIIPILITTTLDTSIAIEELGLGSLPSILNGSQEPQQHEQPTHQNTAGDLNTNPLPNGIRKRAVQQSFDQLLYDQASTKRNYTEKATYAIKKVKRFISPFHLLLFFSLRFKKLLKKKPNSLLPKRKHFH